MKTYKRKLKLKQKYVLPFTIIMTVIVSVALALFLSWRVEQIDGQVNKEPQSVKIFGD